MSQAIIFNNSPSNRYILAGLFSCSLLLVACSFVQKIIAGYNPFLPKGYIIPIVFGAIAGGLLGSYLHRIKVLNTILEWRIHGLENLLSICSHCKKIRKPDTDPRDRDSWIQIESYLSQHSATIFSHGLCPDCYEERAREINNFG